MLMWGHIVVEVKKIKVLRRVRKGSFQAKTKPEDNLDQL